MTEGAEAEGTAMTTPVTTTTTPAEEEDAAATDGSVPASTEEEKGEEEEEATATATAAAPKAASAGESSSSSSVRSPPKKEEAPEAFPVKNDTTMTTSAEATAATTDVEEGPAKEKKEDAVASGSGPSKKEEEEEAAASASPKKEEEDVEAIPEKTDATKTKEEEAAASSSDSPPPKKEEASEAIPGKTDATKTKEEEETAAAAASAGDPMEIDPDPSSEAVGTAAKVKAKETPIREAVPTAEEEADAAKPTTESAEPASSGRRPRRSRIAAREAVAKPAATTAANKPANDSNGPKKKKQQPKASSSEAAAAEAAEARSAVDALNVGRLVERNKHVAGSGQLYPHHGRILGLLPREGRVPERWTVEWEDPLRDDNDDDEKDDDETKSDAAADVVVLREEWTRGDLEEHDGLIEAWQNPFRVYNGRRQEMARSGPPLKAALDRLRERYHGVVVRDIEHESFGAYTSCGTKGKASRNNNGGTDARTTDGRATDGDESAGAGDLLPTLLLMAALEDALQASLTCQRAREAEQQRVEGTETNANAGAAAGQGGKRGGGGGTHSHPPLYYGSNPNQYLVAPSREADAEEDLRRLEASRNPRAVVTPAVLAQRVRDGCQWAVSYLRQRHEEDCDDEDDDDGSPPAPRFLEAPDHTAIAATALELEAKKAKEAVLRPPPPKEEASSPAGDAAGEEEQQQPRGGSAVVVVEQRRSIRSGLGERAELFDPTTESRRSTRRGLASYAESSSEVTEPNPVQKGGRVALWWLRTLEEDAKRLRASSSSSGESDEDENEDGEDAAMEDAETSAPPNDDDDDDEATSAPKASAPDKSEAAAASNLITGDSYEDAMGGGADDEDDTAAKATDDEDFEMTASNVDEDSDDQLDNVEKERSLTPIPESGGDEDESDDDDDDDDDEEEEDEEEVDEEHAVVWENPYLTPSVPAILEYLSKPKSITGEDVQRAMDDVTLRLRHNRRTAGYGLPVSSLEAHDRAVLRWENPDHPAAGNLVLRCVGGETVSELQRLDVQAFGRCKFELEIIGAEEATVQIRNRADFEQRSEEHKARRHNDRWRFKGIHEGHAVWPSWKEEARRWIEARVGSSAMDTSGGGGGNAAAEEEKEDDAALARRLAEEAAKEAEADAVASSSSRRTGRRSRSSRGGGSGSDGGVFYGNQSSMTQKQLMDALIRLVTAAGSSGSTLSRLQELVADDSSDPLRRIRIALGKILWKRNLLAKLPVASTGSDAGLRKALESGLPLVRLDGDDDDDAEEKSERRPEDAAETPDLLGYLSGLHRTELRLRDLLLRQLGTIPLPVIATAADERPGTLECMDAPDFDDDSIEWKTDGSDLLGKVVYRPAVESTLGDERTPCRFYEIEEWSESVPSEADDAEEHTTERRKRFRAAPLGGGRKGGESLLLTEAQVHAGIVAAELGKQREQQQQQQQPTVGTDHPFATEIGDHITLVALDEDEDEENDAAESDRTDLREISGRVVGHDSVREAAGNGGDDDATDVKHRILVLPDEPTADGGKKPAPPFWAVLEVRDDTASFVCRPDDGRSIRYSIENQDFHADSEPYKACEGVLGWLSRQSKAMPFLEPVDPVALGIPTYPDVVKNPMDVSTVTEKLEAGAYSTIPPAQLVGTSLVCRMLNGPFRRDLELIFDNAMLFNPPDDWISQAAASLKKSVGKKIDNLAYAAERKHASGGSGGAGSGGRRSIYADEDSDVDMYEYESDEDYDGGGGGGRRGKRKRSSAASSATARAASNKDEAAARPMEQPIKLQNYLKDGTDLRGRFAGLPLNGYASTYSMPPFWSCRRRRETPDDEEAEREEEDAEDEDERSPAADREYVQEMADLLALHKRFGEAEASGLRRSSRETRPTTGRRSSNRDKAREASKKTEGLEYYLPAAEEAPAADASSSSSFSSIPSSRLDVEILLEKRHEEHYAKLYRKHESDLVSCCGDGGKKKSSGGDSAGNDNGEDEEAGRKRSGDGESRFGLYSSDSFPPYLGRVVPSRNRHGWTWEIRPPFAVPALRWILRGLVGSGHLTATESLYGGNSGSNAYDVTAGAVLLNDVYYADPERCVPFETLDTRFLQRKKRANADGEAGDSEEDEVEMSEYEKLRAERVARNAERLKALGLA